MGIAQVLKKKRFISIDFGQEFIKIMYLEAQEQGVNLVAYDLKKISCTEANKPQIINFINNFLKTNSITEKEASFSITDPESIIIKPLTLPELPRSEVIAAMKWQLKDQAHFDLSTAIFDWQLVKEYSDEEGAKKNEIICVAARAGSTDKYLSVINACKLIPLRASSSPFNYAYILRALGRPEPGAVAVLDMGHRQATLCIYKENNLFLVRELAISLDKLTRSLSSTLVSAQGRIELSPERAKEIITEFGIPQDDSAILKDIRAIHIISLMRPSLETLTKELQRSFEYFSLTFKEETPKLMYITGGGANLKNLDWYLHKELNMGISCLPIPFSINAARVDKQKLNQDYNQLMNALGVILAGAGAINLLPQELKEEKAERIQRAFLRTISIALAAVLLFSFSVLQFKVQDYQKRLKYAYLHLNSIGNIRDIKDKVEAKKKLIDKIQKNSVPAHSLLKVIGALTPQDIIIDELSLEQPANACILKGLISEGSDSGQTILNRLIERLEATAFFKDCALVSFKGTRETDEFQIRCDLIR